jgi:ketosteroid isomerase-like protein
MGTKDEPKDVVMSYIDALDRFDYDAALKLLSSDVRVRGPAGESFGAPTGFIEMLRSYRGRYDIKRTFVDGDEVCLWYDLKTTGPTMFMASWYQVSDGKIVRIQTIFDPSALGPSPARNTAEGGSK